MTDPSPAAVRAQIRAWVGRDAHWLGLLDAGTADDGLEAYVDAVAARLARRAPDPDGRLPVELVCRQEMGARCHALCATDDPQLRTRGLSAVYGYVWRRAAGFFRQDIQRAHELTQRAVILIDRDVRTVMSPTSFLRWCDTLVIRERMKMRREAANSPPDDKDEALQAETRADDEEPALDQTVLDRIVHSAIWQCLYAVKRLSTLQKALVALSAKLDLKPGELATLTRVKASRLYVLLHRARNTLAADDDFLACLRRIGLREDHE